MANESNSKFIKLVSTGLIDLHLTLILSEHEAEHFKVFPAKIDKMADCASFLSAQGVNLFMTSSQIESKKLNIFDNIRLSSNNPTINTLLVLNRAFKKKIFVEYVTLNEIRFCPEESFMKDVLKFITEQNFLFLVENKFLQNSLSQIKFEIKINNKTVKVFENICDNSNSNNIGNGGSAGDYYDNSIQINDEIKSKSDSNNNLNNFNINLQNFNNSNTNNDNNINIDINKNNNANDHIEPAVNMIPNSADQDYNSSNLLINRSKLKSSSNKQVEEVNDGSNSNEQHIDFSVNHNNHKEDLFANKFNNSLIKSKVTGSGSGENSNNINNNNQNEKETSRLLLENDLLQENSNNNIKSPSATSARAQAYNNQRSLGSNNNDLLNNIDNTPERLQSGINSSNNHKGAHSHENEILRSDYQEAKAQQDVNQIGKEFATANSDNNINNIHKNDLSLEKQDGDVTANQLLHSIEDKMRIESYKNTNNNLSSNKLLNQNSIIQKTNNILDNEALNNKSINNYFKENENNNNDDDYYNENSNNKFLLMNQNNFSRTAGEEAEKAYSNQFGANLSPNTNFNKSNTPIRLPKPVFERFRYDFSGCNYFFVDLNEIISLQNFNFSLREFLEFLKKITMDFCEIKVVTTFPNIIKNIALLDLESLTYISEIVSLTDIYVFEKKEALALFNLLAQLRSESRASNDERKNLEFLFIREIKRKNRPYPKLGMFLEGLKKCTIIQQQQDSSNSVVVFHTDYEFTLIAPNVSSIVFDDYQKILENNALALTSVFLGGFFSRFLYKKSFNACFTAGNESLKRIIELKRFGVEPPLDFNYYLIRIKKKEKVPSEAQNKDKKKEQNFVLDSLNIVNSKMRNYNPLYDSNLVSFFSSKLTRTHLQKSGFIDRNGTIVDDPQHKKITISENFQSKTSEKNFEQEKHNLLKVKEQKDKMRMQMKSLMNLNSQALRAGSLTELDKLAKLYTYNPALSRKLPDIDLKKSAAALKKTTKFDNNLFLKEISKGNKPKSLFNFNPAVANGGFTVGTAGFNNRPGSLLGVQKGNNYDIEIHQNDGKSQPEKIIWESGNGNNRISSYNISSGKSGNRGLTGNSKERENTKNNFSSSTNNNRVVSGNYTVNTVNNMISSASRTTSNVRRIAAATDGSNNKRVDSNYSKNNLKTTEKVMLLVEAEIKEEDLVNVHPENQNENINENNKENKNENLNENNNNNEPEDHANNAEKAQNLNSSKISAAIKKDLTDLATENNQVNNQENNHENNQEMNNSNINVEQAENTKEEQQNSIIIPNGENNPQNNVSRNENKNISNADLNVSKVSKRSKKFDVNNNMESDSSSKKSKTEENMLHPNINETKEVDLKDMKEDAVVVSGSGDKK